MPRVKIDYVVSFSSEDPGHPAANLLQESASGRCWLACAGSGTASVVLQLARAVRISSLSLGAHRSALVEVLVGRSETPQYEVKLPLKVLVPRCVLQTPTEARRGSNPDRVRSFSAEQMAEATRNKSWDRVRVVCSQPYDKHCKFGLSFVHIFEPEDALPTARPQQLTLDSLRRDSSEDESFRPGALFAAHLQTSGSPAQTSGNQIREATSRALKHIADTATHLVKTPLSIEKTRQKNRDRPSTCKTDERPHKIREKERFHRDDEIAGSAESRNERNSNFDNSVAGKETGEDKVTTKDKSNERRSSVNGKESRHKGNDKQRETDQSSKNNRDVESGRRGEASAGKERRNREGDRRERDGKTPNKDKKDGRRRKHEDTSRQDEQRTLQDEECDTDDEIEKFLRKQKRKVDQANTSPNRTEPPSEDVTRTDQTDSPTRENERTEISHRGQENTQSQPSGVLPAFLDGLTFAVDSGVSKIGFDEQLIRRYVVAYGGEVVEEAECANYLLCGTAPEQPASAPLRADWVWRCHQRGRRARLQPYLLT